MALLLALLMPIVMLIVVCALGRYEEALLKPPAELVTAPPSFTPEEGGEDT
ncbi:hypothetical protein [Streptomyces sp. NPDC048639]|uniref:hypothetical protein n=1 Tax=Streptomyces sp. NPDC048639 TaxID=3365581 RepID=UPI0037150394